MKCPRDHTELVRETLEKKSFMRCPSCQGHFIGLTGTKLQGIQLSRLHPKSTPCILKKGVEALVSPSSNKPMKHFVFKELRLDYCKDSNSVWMDKGELDSIIKKLQTKNKNKNKNKNNKTSEYGILDGLGDGVVEVIGDIIAGLFDGI